MLKSQLLVSGTNLLSTLSSNLENWSRNVRILMKETFLVRRIRHILFFRCWRSFLSRSCFHGPWCDPYSFIKKRKTQKTNILNLLNVNNSLTLKSLVLDHYKLVITHSRRRPLEEIFRIRATSIPSTRWRDTNWFYMDLLHPTWKFYVFYITLNWVYYCLD